MEKVYDPATGHEVRELTGKNAGQKYLVDSSGVYAGLYGLGTDTGITTASGLGTDTGITTATGLGTDTGITTATASDLGTDTGITTATAIEVKKAIDLLAAGVGNQPKFLEYDINGDGKISSLDALAYLNQGIADGTMNADGTFAQAASVSNEVAPVSNEVAPVSNEVAPVYSAPDYSGAINTGFADLSTSLGTNFGAAQTDRAAMNTLASNREALATSGRNQLGTNLNTGFQDMGGRFDTVDTNVGNVQSAVDQGFVDQSAGFADAQTDRNAQSLAAQTDRNAQFAATGAAMNTGFDNTAAGQTNIIKGQTGIGTTLETMGNTADIYAGQSLENQQAMQQGIDTQASTFDDYIDRYSDDTRFAQDSRQDLALAQANFANNMADDQQIYYNNLGRDINTQKLQLDAIRNQQLQDAAAQVEAAYQNSLSQIVQDANAQSGQQAPSGLGSPFAVTQ